MSWNEARLCLARIYLSETDTVRRSYVAMPALAGVAQWVDDAKWAVLLALRQIFGIEDRGAGTLRGLHNESVPKRDIAALLDDQGVDHGLGGVGHDVPAHVVLQQLASLFEGQGDGRFCGEDLHKVPGEPGC